MAIIASMNTPHKRPHRNGIMNILSNLGELSTNSFMKRAELACAHCIGAIGLISANFILEDFSKCSCQPPAANAEWRRRVMVVGMNLDNFKGKVWKIVAVGFRDSDHAVGKQPMKSGQSLMANVATQYPLIFANHVFLTPYPIACLAIKLIPDNRHCSVRKGG